MQQISYWEAVRRRWPLIVVLAILGGLIAIVIPISGQQPKGHGPLVARFEATATVAAAPGGQGGSGNASQVVAASRNTAVDAATASSFYKGLTADDIAGAVTLAPNSPATAAVTGTASTPRLAAKLANAYANSIINYLAQVNNSLQKQELTAANNRVTTIKSQLSSIAGQVAAARGGPANNPQLPTLQAQAQALQSSYQSAYQQYTQLSSEPPPGSGLVLAQPASPATAVLAGAKHSTLTERRFRGPIGVAIGLIVGLLLALLLEQLDQRVRGRADAEEASGLPVLAEVPRYRLSRSMHDVVVDSAPLSRSAEAYRTVRTVLLAHLSQLPETVGSPFSAGELPSGMDTVPGAGDEGGWYDTMQLAVAPPRPVNGLAPAVALACPEALPTRPVAIANLAAAFSEYGYSVILLSVEAGRYEPIPDREGVGGAGSTSRTSASTGRTEGVLDQVLRPTKIAGVERAVVSEIPAGAPGSLPSVVEEARRRADIVLIDTAPVLSAHEAGVVAGLVDLMVVVAQCRWTRRSQLRRTTDFLGRVHAPMFGVLLTQVDGRRRWRSGSRATKPSWTVEEDARRPAGTPVPA